MHYDVAIIGAGMSGLAAGIRLACHGVKVCILEKHYRVGGLNSYYSQNGHEFDVGLHSVTNYVPKGVRSTPLPKLLRQLKLPADAFALCQQRMSAIVFPDVTLRFNNEIDFLTQEVADRFPAQADNFRTLLKTLANYDQLTAAKKPVSARGFVASIISDPLLVEMILCPIMFYGNAEQDDMDFVPFVIMFRSIFCEGLARPQAGVRHILKVLVDKYRGSGGELRLRSGVRSVRTRRGKVETLVLDNGEEITADKVLSSAGYVETMALLTDGAPAGFDGEAGQLSFIEVIVVLEKEPAELGHDMAIVFFNNSDRFHYRKPEHLADFSSGVICCPGNFHYGAPQPEAMARVTHLANFDLWNRLNENDYHVRKASCLESSLTEVARFLPDFRDSIVATDLFTPKTINRFTGHSNGAVYGSHRKRRTGATHLDNLFVCGADQGLVGIVGAMLSGISMANLHVLQKLN